jgi:hypothetical protein
VWAALVRQWALVKDATKRLSQQSAETAELRIAHVAVREEAVQAREAEAMAREDATKAQEEAAKAYEDLAESPSLVLVINDTKLLMPCVKCFELGISNTFDEGACDMK